MAGDIPLWWELLTPYGIQINEGEDAWWSGHVTDVLELDQGGSGLLVATETGGVWTIATNGTTMPLSDNWDWPDVNCLAAGPGGPRHFFAGCTGRNDDGRKFNGRAPDDGVIYETDPTSTTPLLTWNPVSSPLPAGAGKVNDLVVLTQNWRIVAACDGGLY